VFYFLNRYHSLDGKSGNLNKGIKTVLDVQALTYVGLIIIHRYEKVTRSIHDHPDVPR